MQGTEDLSACESSIGGIGALPCAFDVKRHHSINLWVITFNTFEVMFQEFATAQLAFADRRDQCTGRLEGNVSHRLILLCRLRRNRLSAFSFQRSAKTE